MKASGETALSLRLAGIDVEVARSWFSAQVVAAAAAAWLVYALLPELGAARASLLGIGTALALSASLLLHELAHALVAQRAGAEVVHIRLFGAGALCRRRAPLERPRDQFLVAAAGPLASVGLAVLLLAGAVTIEILGLASGLSLAIGVVAFANVLIALSNLIPVFPFDGGKLVHALFWRHTSDHTMATGRLRRSGQEFARIVTTLGILTMAFAGDLMMGLVIAGFGIYLMFLPPPA